VKRERVIRERGFEIGESRGRRDVTRDRERLSEKSGEERERDRDRVRRDVTRGRERQNEKSGEER
jgi:hypothetical protein